MTRRMLTTGDIIDVFFNGDFLNTMVLRSLCEYLKSEMKFFQEDEDEDDLDKDLISRGKKAIQEFDHEELFVLLYEHESASELMMFNHCVLKKENILDCEKTRQKVDDEKFWKNVDFLILLKLAEQDHVFWEEYFEKFLQCASQEQTNDLVRVQHDEEHGYFPHDYMKTHEKQFTQIFDKLVNGENASDEIIYDLYRIGHLLKNFACYKVHESKIIEIGGRINYMQTR